MDRPAYFVVNIIAFVAIGLLLVAWLGLWAWVVALFGSPIATAAVYGLIQAVQGDAVDQSSIAVASGDENPVVTLLPETQTLLGHMEAEHRINRAQYEANVAAGIERELEPEILFGTTRSQRGAMRAVLTNAHDSLDLLHRMLHENPSPRKQPGHAHASNEADAS